MSGMVVDRDTKEGLPFAMMQIQKTGFGTVSNIDGEFELTYPYEYAQDTLIISMVGYHSLKYPLMQDSVATDSTLGVTIALEANPIKLDEVTVRPDEPPAKELMSQAIGNIKNNYPQSPFLLHGFFRDLKIEEEECVFLLEAAVRIYDKRFDKAPRVLRDLQERVAIDKMRATQNYIGKKSWKESLDKENALTALLGNNMVRYQYGPFSLDDKLAYERAYEVQLDSQLLYVVSVPSYPETEIFIDSETYGIRKFVFQSTEEQNLGSASNISDRVVVAQHIQFEFQQYQGKLYLKYIFSNSKFEEREKKTGKVLHTSELRLSLIVTDIETSDVERISGRETMGKYSSLEMQLSASYDEDFWENYNIIKENPVNQKLIDDLRRKSTQGEVFQREGK